MANFVPYCVNILTYPLIIWNTRDMYSVRCAIIAIIDYSAYMLCACVPSVPQPSVAIMQSDEASVSGLNRTITCTVTVVEGVSPSLVMVEWSGGDSLSDSPRVTISDQTNDGLQYTRIVTFSPLLSDDSGQYTCSVSVMGFDEADNSADVTIMVDGK